MAGKELLTKLADAGEDAIGRLSKSPGADQVVGALQALRERVDEMQKHMLVNDAIEARLTALEKRIDKLEGKGTRKRSTAKPAASKSTRKPSAAATATPTAAADAGGAS
jgi:uncharacterized protein YjcR